MIVSSLNFQISGIIGTANSFTTSNLKVVEKRYLEEIKAFDEKIMKIRLNTLEMVQNFEKDKNQLIDEFKSLKNMKQDLIELINSSIKKVNITNNLIKQTLDNFEIEFYEIKNSIKLINEKLKKENKNTRHNLRINNEKINYYNLPIIIIYPLRIMKIMKKLDIIEKQKITKKLEITKKLDIKKKMDTMKKMEIMKKLEITI